MICFEESCIPPKTAHHAKKIVRFGGFTRLADKPALVAAKSFWDSLLLGHRPETPLDGPARLHIELTWPWNTGDTKKARQFGRIPHDVKPDLENTAKTIIDAAVRCGYIVNDSRIVDLHLTKWRGDSPGIRFELRAL